MSTSKLITIKLHDIKLPALMGLMHGINDCVAGFVLGSLAASSLEVTDVGWWILIYNALAFGGQAPLALITDQWNLPKPLLVLAALCNGAGLLLFGASPLMAVVFLGVGSALVHITGGSITLQHDPGKAGALGLFTAPGVLGLALGGLMAYMGLSAALPLLWGTIAVVTLALFMPISSQRQLARQEHGVQLDKHDWVMMLLLLVIAMRSAIWNTFQLINQGDYYLLLYLAAAAMGGKMAGGYIADKVGWRNYALGALLLAAPLLTFGGKKPWLLAIGVGLLQSVTPLTLGAMHRALPTRPALATGLTLGLAIALGGVPMLMGYNWFNEPMAILLGTLLLAGAYFGILKLQAPNSKRVIDSEPV